MKGLLPRVYLTEPIHPDAQAQLGRSVVLDVGDSTLTIDELRLRLGRSDVIISKTDPIPIGSRIIDAAPTLKLIARHGSGYSNVDVDYATEKGIVVTNTPGASAISVTEFTLGLVLMAARKLPQAIAACRIGNPDRLSYSGMELQGKVFGIIGVGRIGREVAKRVHALGMEVLAHHPRPSAEGLVDLPLQLVEMRTLLSRSDVISLHVPLNQETRNLIGKEEIALMKRTAILINLSRGGVVEERALYEALASDRLHAAATDVLENEPVAADDPLLRLDNCIITPHIAAVTEEAQRSVAFAVVEEVVRFARGEPLHHVVNPSALGPARGQRTDG